MTEYDFSPEAYEAYQKKIKGVGKWAAETSRFNGDFPSPFAPSPAETRRPLSKDDAAGSDSDSDLTSCSRRRRPVHPQLLTQWPGSRSRAATPRQPQAPPPPPGLGQRPPPVRSHTLPNQIYVQKPPPRIQQPQPQYPYPVQRPVVYNLAQQPVITQQQQQSKIYVPRIPKRTNTTPSKPLAYQYPHGVAVQSAGASPYATPLPSPHSGSATHPSPRTPSKNWLSRMLGSLSIRGRSASPAPTSYNSGKGPGHYESTTRHPRSRSLDPTAYRSEHHRERDREKDNRSEQTRRSRSTRSTRHYRHSDDSDREHGHGRHHDRGRDRERERDRYHRRARSDVGHR